MEEALADHLLVQTGLTSVVGQRINWGRRDQGGPLPAIVLHLIDGPRDYHLAGPSGLIAARVQADCWGLTFNTAKSAARALEAVVTGARFTRSAVRFDGIFVIDEGDDSQDLNGKPLFRTRLDLAVHHASAT